MAQLFGGFLLLLSSFNRRRLAFNRRRLAFNRHRLAFDRHRLAFNRLETPVGRDVRAHDPCIPDSRSESQDSKVVTGVRSKSRPPNF